MTDESEIGAPDFWGQLMAPVCGMCVTHLKC